MRVAVVANGETPEGAALDVLRSAGVVVACDGAYARLKSLRIEPDFVVGDCDSLSEEDRKALGTRLVRVDEQETNDLEKAFRFALSHAAGGAGDANPDAPPCGGIAIVGAGGGREDHLIGNVFRMIEFAEREPGVAMLTNAGRFDVVKGERAFDSVPGQAVSVFAPIPGTKMESSGLEWPLGGVDLSRLWSGTLNRATGTSFAVRSSAPAIVYRAW